MGLTHIRATISNYAHPRKTATLRFLVDSGAALSVVPATVLRRLGIKPHSQRTFILADGMEIKRRLGTAVFHLEGRHGVSPVLFGEAEDSTLLGFVTLEALGVFLDPFKRELRPFPALLGGKVMPMPVFAPPPGQEGFLPGVDLNDSAALQDLLDA